MDISMLPDFIVEAVEHLEEMENGLLHLEQDQENVDILNEIFRSIHSIKGAAQYIGLERVSELSHRLESLLDLIRQGKKPLNEDTIDLFITAKDRINLLVNELELSQTEHTEVDDLLIRINSYLDDSQQEAKPSNAKVKGHSEVSLLSPAKNRTRLENECLQEDYDEKLVDIFLQNLKEKLGFLQTHINELDSSPDKEGVMGRCSDIIEILSSSSHYMGYDLLCDYYQAWQEEIKLLRVDISSGEEIELDFMQEYLNEIVDVYPLPITNTDQHKTEETATDSEHDKLDETFESPLSDSLEDLVLPEDFDDNYPFAEEPIETEKEGLVAELSDAFDETTGNVANDEHDKLDETFESSLNDSYEEPTTPEELDDDNPLDENPLEATHEGLRAELSDAFDETTGTVANGEHDKLDETFESPLNDSDKEPATPEELDDNSPLDESPLKATHEGLHAELSDAFDETTDTVANGEHDKLNETFESPLNVSYEEPATPEELDDDSPLDENPLEATHEGLHAEEATGLVNESLAEEYEEELLDIFIQNLKENIAFLQVQINELDNSLNQEAVLDRCKETIRSLSSSAKYMGYNMLCDHYQAWQSEIGSALQGISSGIETELSFMQGYLAEILRVYPEATSEIDQQHQESAKDDDAADLENDHLEETLDSLFNEFPEDSDAPEQGNAIPTEDEGEHEEIELPEVMNDPIGATTDTLSPAREVTRLKNESVEEEYDKELLGIFMLQLRENIGFLRNQIIEFENSFDQKAVFDRCSDALKKLRSSANYMGYDVLCQHYAEWQTAIDSTVDDLLSEAEIDFSFMQAYLDEVDRVYPNTETKAEQQVDQSVPEARDDSDITNWHDNLADPFEPAFNESPEDTATQEQEEDINGSVDLGDVAPTIGSLLSEPSDAVGNFLVEEKELENNIEGKSSKIEEEALVPSSDKAISDQLLFGKLSSALETSLDGDVSVPVKQMRNVIEEMITSSGDDVVEEQPTAKETTPQKTTPSMTLRDSTAPDESALITKEDVIADQKQDNDQHQELPEAKQMPVKPLPETRREQDTTSVNKVRQSMRVDADKIDYLMNQVGELVVSRAYFSQLFSEMKTLQQSLLEKTGMTKTQLKPLNEFSFRLGEAGVALGRVSNELQEAVMKVRMLPISQLFKRYPRLVRDLVKKSGKQVDLVVRGEDTELDKMVIEEISDPLIHVIRNAVDHGIETISERRQLGKPEIGTLTLEAYHESNHIVIEIIDDGKGIDPEFIKVKAMEKGLYTEDELARMPPMELTRIIMLPGFSTADRATETSGRGVGMDVVKKNIDKLNGTIDIESMVGQQTRFRIKIPLTLAIIQALMVRVDLETFTVPLTAVEETLRIYPNEISEIEGVEVIHLRDATMPIFRLSKIFDMRKKSETTTEDKLFVVVVSTGMQSVGLVVDELLGQEEVVIKPLAEYLRVGSGFSGATIIGDGAISLILDVPELVQMTTERQISKQKHLAFNRRRKGIGANEHPDSTVH